MNDDVHTLVGHSVRSFEHQGHTWVLSFDEGIKIATDAEWRLIAEGRIVVTSDDHGHPFGLPERHPASVSADVLWLRVLATH